MTHFAVNSLAMAMFINCIGIANAMDPGEYSAIPEVLSSINSTSYKHLSNIEMAKIVGGVIPSGMYNISVLDPNSNYTGTANILLVDQTKGIYHITYTYMRSGNLQLSSEGVGFEYNNILSVISITGAEDQSNFIIYNLNSNGSLTGRRWIGPNFTFVTETLTKKP